MSYHVYISKPGFKDDPIDKEDWINVAKHVSEITDNFVVEKRRNRNNEQGYDIHLSSSKRQWLHMTPYGLIHAQNPSRELIEIMFIIANKLDANVSVYSERNVAYSSPDEWEKRTKNYCKRTSERREIAKKKQNIKKVVVLLAVIIGLAVSFLR